MVRLSCLLTLFAFVARGEEMNSKQSCNDDDDIDKNALLQVKSSLAETQDQGEEATKDYVYHTNSSIAGAGAKLYQGVADAEACSAICVLNTDCVGFILEHKKDADGNHECYVASSWGQNMYYNPCCDVGIPFSRTTTTTTTTALAGVYTLQYKNYWKKANFCAMQKGDDFVIDKCDGAGSEAHWQKSSKGYYTNVQSGKCIGFGKKGDYSNAFNNKLIPMDVPGDEQTADEQCAHLNSRKNLEIGRTFMSTKVQSCYSAVEPDGKKYWYQCSIQHKENVMGDKIDYLVALSGYRRSFDEVEVGSSGVQVSELEMQAETNWDWRHKKCPTPAQVKATPKAKRHECWDGSRMGWWERCKFNQRAGQCGPDTPCLVKPLQKVSLECLSFKKIDSTSFSPTGDPA